jgi:hypothetical protein
MTISTEGSIAILYTMNRNVGMKICSLAWAPNTNVDTSIVWWCKSSSKTARTTGARKASVTLHYPFYTWMNLFSSCKLKKSDKCDKCKRNLPSHQKWLVCYTRKHPALLQVLHASDTPLILHPWPPVSLHFAIQLFVVAYLRPSFFFPFPFLR